jgi:hypothetical protein
VNFLEKQKERTLHLAEGSDQKVIIFDLLVDMSKKEYDIQIKKNYKPEFSTISKSSSKKHKYLPLIYSGLIDRFIFGQYNQV